MSKPGPAPRQGFGCDCRSLQLPAAARASIFFASKVPGVEHVVTVSGISILDNRASLANAGVAFVVMKEWDERLKAQGQDQESIQRRINGGLQSIPEAFSFAVLPPPIQGVGNVGGFTMQIEIRNGDFDYDLLQSLANTVVADGNAQSGLQRLATTFRAGAPQFSVVVDRTKAEALGITVGQVFAALSGYVGSNYVTQFNQFGHVFQVYTQANAEKRASVEDIRNLKVRAGNGTMTPIGTAIEVSQVTGPPLISLYNLYPTATVVGSPAPGFSSGQALDIMDQVGDVLVSTTYSKSVLRVAAEQVQKRLEFVDYFPSYEIITGSYNFGHYYEEDAREVNSMGVSHAMRIFFRHYAEGAGESSPPPRPTISDATFGENDEASEIVCDEEALAAIRV